MPQKQSPTTIKTKIKTIQFASSGLRDTRTILTQGIFGPNDEGGRELSHTTDACQESKSETMLTVEELEETDATTTSGSKLLWRGRHGTSFSSQHSTVAEDNAKIWAVRACFSDIKPSKQD